MTKRRGSQWLAKSLGQVSLRTYIIALFVIPITITVALISTLSFASGRQAVDELAHQLQLEIAARIEQEIDSYLEIPLLINEINADNIRTGLIDPTDQSALESYFWHQIQHFDKASYIYLGNQAGGFVGAGRVRQSDSPFTIEVTPHFEPGAFEIYATDDQGRRTELLSAAPDYDARIRPWYAAAQQAGQPVWSDIFAEFTNQTLSVATSRPVYDSNGTLQGILGTEIALEQIDTFLQGLEIGKTGQAFIINRSGQLIAASTFEGVPLADRFFQQPPTAFNSKEPLVRAGADYLTSRFGSLEGIEQPQQLLFSHENSDQFLYITPFSDNSGLDWLIVVIIPRSDFMQEINQNLYTTLGLSVLGLTAAIVLGVLTSRWVTKPLLRLNDATQALAAEAWQGDTDTAIKTTAKRDDEVGQLARSFLMMATQLQTTVGELRRHRDHLEERVAERTVKLKEVNEALTEDIVRREKIEQELSIFAQIVEHVGYAVVDTNLHIRSSNDRFKDWIEDDFESLAGQTITDVLPELMGLEGRLQQMIHQHTGIVKLSKIYRPAAEGSGRYFNLQVEPLHASDSLLLARINDVTTEAQLEIELRNESNKLRLNIEQREQAERALRESERRLVETQRLAQLGSWEFDLATETFTWSEEMFRITGLDPQAETPSLAAYLETVHPDDAKRLAKMFKQAADKGTVYTIELRHLHPDGKIRYVVTHGQPISSDATVVKLIGYVLDITERKRTEHIIQSAHDELAQRVGEMALLNSVTQTVATVTDLPEALELVAREMVMAFNARNSGITLINHERTHLEVVADYSKDPGESSAKGIILPLEGNLATQKVFETKQSIVVEKAQINPLLASIHDVMKARSTECIMIVPLLARGDVIGTIGLDTTNPNRVFSQEEMTLAETIAGQIAGAIEVARLFEEEHRQRRIAESLRHVAATLSSSLDLQIVLDKIMEELRNVIDYDSSGLSLQDKNDLVLFASANLPAHWDGAHIPLTSDDPAAQVFRKRTPMIIRDLHEPPYDDIWAGSKQVRAWMGVPLMVGNVAIGMLGVDSFTVGAYTEEDVKILQLFAHQAAGAIQNAQLHQQLRHEKQLFETLLFNSPVAAVMILPHSYEVTSWNPAAETLFGYTQKEVIGQSIYDLVTPDPIRTHAVKYGQQISQGQSVRVIEQRSRKDGSLVDVEILAVPVMIDQEQVAIMIIYHDITQLEQARQAAEAANQAKSEFLSNMSHELRTPLNAIIGFSQLMMQNKSTKEHALPLEYEENLRIIHRSGEHLLTLINNVLSLSKIESGRTILHEKDFDLYQMLDDLEDMFRLRARVKQLQLTVERTKAPQFIRTDEVKLRQVLINLLNNALKFTEEGGVALRVWQQRNASPTEATALEPTSPSIALHFEVEDTGPGIAPEDIETIFEAFTQTHTGQISQEGTGLGLTISHKFVRLMGGELSVRSTLRHGSVFQFDIIAHPAQVGDVSPPRRSRSVIGLAPNQTTYRILVVDDSSTNRQLVKKLLQPLGFEVQEAGNGQEAVEIWQSWEPHLVWMDMRMPIMDGYEATRKIKATAKGQDTVVIALTASTFEEERAVVASAGCDDFLRKPFRETELFTMMQKHIGVQYIFEESEAIDGQTAGAEKESAPPLDESALSQTQIKTAIVALPENLVEKLKEAATRSDMVLVDDVIASIEQYSPPLAHVLANLAQDFEYDEILALLDAVEE
ncbi:MAG: PAS domain S-box protein [Anaerolineae bacterium]|nr:PAS domain S-box protein [Anaerolineae bacterium]